jgi:hypothetical protein
MRSDPSLDPRVCGSAEVRTPFSALKTCCNQRAPYHECLCRRHQGAPSEAAEPDPDARQRGNRVLPAGYGSGASPRRFARQTAGAFGSHDRSSSLPGRLGEASDAIANLVAEFSQNGNRLTPVRTWKSCFGLKWSLAATTVHCRRDPTVAIGGQGFPVRTPTK